MNRYLLAYSLPESVTREVANLYEAIFSQKIAIQMLHISFDYPFELQPNVAEAELIQALEKLEIEPFKARLGKIGLFKQKKMTLYVSVHPKASFIAAHDQLRETISPLVTFNTQTFKDNNLPVYQPHLSLSYAAEKLSETAIETYREAFGEIHFVVDEVGLYKAATK